MQVIKLTNQSLTNQEKLLYRRIV